MKHWTIGLLLCVACSPPPPKGGKQTFVPRDERFPPTFVDYRGLQRLVVTRTAQPGEAIPKEGDVTAWLLDLGSNRLDATVQLDLGATSTAAIEFTPRNKEPLELFINWGAEVGLTAQRVVIVERLDTSSDFEVTYVDRMDLCRGGPLRGASGRVFCERGETVWVYDTEGNIETSFNGFDLAVFGDEIWSGTWAGYEHRTDLENAPLRYDGLVPQAPAWPFGELRRGRALRGTPDGFIEVTWDGTTLTSRPLLGYPGLEIEGAAVFSDGDRLTMAGPLCALQKGCAQTSCMPVRTCVDGEPHALGLSSQFVWSTTRDGSGALALRSRDRIGVEVARVVFPFAGSPSRFQPLDLMSRRLAFDHAGFSSIPVNDESEAWMQIWPHLGRSVSATDDWLIASPSPFTLRFHRRVP